MIIGWKSRGCFVCWDHLTVRSFRYEFSALNTCGSCRFLEFEDETGVCFIKNNEGEQKWKTFTKN